MYRSHTVLNTASSVAQDKQGRVRSLGRGLRSANLLRSPFKKLRIIQCNINGLGSKAMQVKLDQIRDLADEHGVQIIALQETKLKSHSMLKMSGFDVYRTDRSEGGGGGLAFLIRDINYKNFHCQSSSPDLEIQGITLNWGNKPLNILNLYHPPNQEHLANDLGCIADEPTIILGDLNAKHTLWGCSEINQRGLDLLNIVDDKALLFLNDGAPTHSSFSYDTKEALDITVTSPDIFPRCKWSVLQGVGSDHLPILIEVDVQLKVHRSKENFWNFKRANWDKFRELIDKKLNQVPFCDNLEENWLFFKGTMIDAAKKSIPRGNLKKFKPDFIHHSQLIQPLIDRRNKLYEEISRPIGSSVRSEMNKVNAEIKRTYNLIKQEKWTELCSKLDARTPDTKLWNLARYFCRDRPLSDATNSITNAETSVPLEDSDAADLLGAHFQKASQIKFCRDDRATARKTRKLIHRCRNALPGGPIFKEKLLFSELNSALADFDSSTSPGPDGIFGLMIVNLSNVAKERLLDLFNQSWSKGRIPKDWKKALVVPILKPGRRADSPENYRPISLTCIPCKIMERIILNRLNFHLTEKNLFPREQYGFRRGHGTIDQILYFCQYVKDAQNKKPTNYTVAAFLDLCKAFDTVWCNKLIGKLFEKFSISGRALPWISDFLSRRKFRVKFKNSLSRSFQLSQGVPQGSVLSPLLFALFIAGIEEEVSQGCEIGIFADDIMIWRSDRDIELIENEINTSLERILKFAKNHKLVFNPLKSVASFFTTNKRLYNYQPRILLDGHPLVYEKHPKYLGFTLDPGLTSNKHIDHLVNKARKRLNILKYISGRDWGADASTLRTTYTSLIRPILEYGYQILRTASNTNLKKLERIQLSAARIITGLRNSCPNEIVLYEANLQPLNLRWTSNISRYFGKLYSFGDQHRTASYLRGWKNNQRLKSDSPFCRAAKQNLLFPEVESCLLGLHLSPLEDLSRVFFHEELLSFSSKKDMHPAHLKQLALETIQSSPSGAVRIFTDGSKHDNGNTGSGIVIVTPDSVTKLSRRNPNFSSVFRSELIAIDVALNFMISINSNCDIWIYSDSRSSIQYLNKWRSINDRLGMDIVNKLKIYSSHNDIHIQWIPSHVDLHFNDLADELAKEGSAEKTENDGLLTYSEIFSKVRADNSKTWRIPPTHDWYDQKLPGAALELKGDRKLQTTITRLITGHTRSLTFDQGEKVFPLCPRCNSHQASPDHLLSCLGLEKSDLFENPALVRDFLWANDLLDLV